MGSDTLTPKKAWQVHVRIMEDSRIRFMPEPDGIEDIWRDMMIESSAHQWTDAYLMAFAETRDLRLVTFDKRLKRSGAEVLS